MSCVIFHLVANTVYMHMLMMELYSSCKLQWKYCTKARDHGDMRVELLHL